MKTLWIAGTACVVGLASAAAHAKIACDVHNLRYTEKQCAACSNMTWTVSRVFPKGACVSTAAAQPVAGGKAPVPPSPGKVCDIHNLRYTEAQCKECSNMRWSVSKYTPRGECVGTTPPQPIKVGGGGKGGAATPAGSGPSCTMTSWGGATIPLSSPNFSGTGVRVSVCSKGYDLAKSQFHCSTGIPVRAFNYPSTNVSCNKTTGAPGGNPQVTINGTACCL